MVRQKSFASFVLVAVIALVVFAIPAHAQNPTGWLKIDEGSGTPAADSSGNGYNATLFNGVNWVTGEIGDAVSANGVNQYVSAPAVNLSSTKAVTVTLWVNRTYSTSGGHTLLEDTPNFNSST